MKKFALMLLLAVSATLAGCKRDVNPADKPSVNWDANPSFNAEYLSTTNGLVTISIPKGLAGLRVKLGGYSGAMLSANLQISSAYQSETSPVFDPVNDSKAAAYLKGRGVMSFTGSALRGATTCSFDIVKLLNSLLSGIEGMVPNNSNFTFNFEVVDGDGVSSSKTATLHYTSAPELTWSGNTGGDTVIISSSSGNKQTVTLTIPGKFKSGQINVSVSSGSTFTDYLRKRTASGTASISLADDYTAFSLLDGNPSGKTGISIRFDTLLDNLFIESPNNTACNMSLTVVDRNDKSASLELHFNVSK